MPIADAICLGTDARVLYTRFAQWRSVMGDLKTPPNDGTKTSGKRGKSNSPLRNKAYLLTISSSKGGSCKSTTTRNLAVAAVHGGLLVATVDLDAQQTLTILNNRRTGAAPNRSH